MKKGLMLSLVACVFLALLSACSTTGSGIKNPKHSDRRLENVAVLALDGSLDTGLKLESALVAALREKGIQAIGITRDMQFVKAGEEQSALRNRLAEAGVQEVMYVAIGDISRSDIVGYNVSGTTINYSASSHTTATAVPMRTFSRNMHISAQIDDMSSGETVWKGSVQRYAQGLLFIGDESMVGNAVEGLIKELEKERLL